MFNAAFRLPNGKEFTVVGIPHLPRIRVIQIIPGTAGQYGYCFSVEKDSPIACLRKYPIGKQTQFSVY